MIRSLPFFIFTLVFLFSPGSVYGQISSFPYVQDFENFTNVQTDPSCNASTAGDTADFWIQDALDDGEWRADRGGTPSLGTGPGAVRNTTGDGLGKDANPGTANGIYLYTESETICTGNEINLISPYFDLSSAGKYYRARLSYHMYGTTIGSLHIDVYADGQWHNDLWYQYGESDTLWREVVINLAGFNSDSVHIRIRAVMGLWDRGDICIDNFIMEEFIPPSHDILINEVGFTNDIMKDYPIYPMGQFDSLELYVRVKNEGLNEVTGAEIEVSEGNYTNSYNLGTIASYDTASTLFNKRYRPAVAGDINLQFNTSINEDDSFSDNDQVLLKQIFSDSVLAREDGRVTGGLGFNGGTGRVGQMFELNKGDTLTSVSFYVFSPRANDSVRVHLFEFGTVPGLQLLSSKTVIYSSGINWYTVKLRNCGEILPAGKYFIAVEQLSANHMSLGYTYEYFKPKTVFYGSWTAVEDGTDFDVTLLIRMNFGTPISVDISTLKDTVCQELPFNLQAKGAEIYRWLVPGGAGVVNSPFSANTEATLNYSSMLKVVGTKCNVFRDTAEIFMTVLPSPKGLVSNDTIACKGDMISLRAEGYDYEWVNGPSNQPYDITVNKDAKYEVRFDSSNGCYRVLETFVKMSEVQLVVPDDTTVCEGVMTSIQAAGAQEYQWLNGPNTATFSFIPDQNDTFQVFGYNNLGCSDSDQVYVEVLPKPNLVVTPDTGVCFTDSVYLRASGADSFQWIGGPSKPVYPLKALQSKPYYIQAWGENGCSTRDTVVVTAYPWPSAHVSHDTTVCEGTAATLSASGGKEYEWSTGQSGATIIYNPSGSGFVRVKVSNEAGCDDEDSIYVGVKPKPLAVFSSFVEFDSVQLTNLSINSLSYEWDFGDGQTSMDEEPYHIYEEEGNYTIVLVATNDCGSSDTSEEITITFPVTDNINELETGYFNTYPVPCTDILHYRMHNAMVGELKVSLMDANGKLCLSNKVLKAQAELSGQLDLSALPAGIYLLKLDLGTSTTAKKIVLE